MRLRQGLGIAAVRSWLPDRVERAEDAVAAERVDAGDAAEMEIESLPVADQAPPEMAVLAARRALAAAGWSPDRLGLLVHAWTYHQGHDFWSPAHYVAAQLGARQALPVGVQQMCNGGAAGVELAAARLLADDGVGAALITTADRFHADGFDRWGGDYGVWYGDGATALLLHGGRDPGDELVLRAAASVAVPEVEALHRGRDPFSPAPRRYGERVDVRRTKKAFAEDVGFAAFYGAAQRALTEGVRRALRDAAVEPDAEQLRLIALPRVGAKVLRETYHPALAGLTKAEIVHLGGRTGHLGAGDGAANLAAVVEQRLLDPGEYALVISAGAGFTFSCLLAQRPG